MTYCLGIKINKGLLFMSDTRTNAGVDNISTFKKIFTFNYKEKVYITILASGNLATTQFLVNSLNDIFREKNKEKSKVFFQKIKKDNCPKCGNRTESGYLISCKFNPWRTG